MYPSGPLTMSPKIPPPELLKLPPLGLLNGGGGYAYKMPLSTWPFNSIQETNTYCFTDSGVLLMGAPPVGR